MRTWTALLALAMILAITINAAAEPGRRMLQDDIEDESMDAEAERRHKHKHSYYKSG